MIYDPVTLLNNRGKKISGRLFRATKPGEKGVIYCHGLFSSQDGYKISSLSGDILKWGFNLFTFDFSFSGESEDELINLSVEQEVHDLKHAYNFFSASGINEIHIIGSSMGGTVALAAASREDFLENKDQLKSVITIASPVELCRLGKKITGREDINSLPAEGFTIADGVKIKNSFFRELCEFNLLETLGDIRIPVLSFHGLNDETVDFKDLDIIRKSLKTECSQVEIDGGDHSLNSSIHIKILKEKIYSWLMEF